MKHVPRNKLLLCFRPVVDMGTVLQTKTLVHCPPTTSLAAYFDLEDDEIRTSGTAPSCQDCHCSRNSGHDSSKISRPPERTLSRTVRAVMFGTILIKRVRGRKSYHQQKSDKRKRSLSQNSGTFPAKEEDESVKGGLGGMYEENKSNQVVSSYSLSSGSSSSFPLSTSESIISSAPTSLVPKTTKKTDGSGSSGVRRKNAVRSCYALNSGVGLLVVSLAVTVMQGRVFGILITSIWVYFFAWMQMEDRWLKKKTKFPETDNVTLRVPGGVPVTVGEGLRLAGRRKNKKRH